jgi:hypothetical protein
MKKPEYIRFVEDESGHLKTRIVRVRTVHSDVLLGTISWYAPWRQYTFRSEPDTVFNTECLFKIMEEVGRMTMDHRRVK